ncbi:unnamed protein product [Schistocephalus solidus]|uniref:Zinc finger protein 830 n=1 Tax=Schistocephalus solidus TaxID=70667 RepID=A0A183TG20_SCHSO|nr:unnamed protein product [Schistocephalus solidus]
MIFYSNLRHRCLDALGPHGCTILAKSSSIHFKEDRASSHQVIYIFRLIFRYNSLGKISCIVCGVPIKSELTWNAHILSKTHKEVTSTPVASSLEPTIQSNLSADPPSQISEKIQKPEAPKKKEEVSKTVLPEGFFDDARRDAEARNVPYRDKLDVEMEAFQKELGSLDHKSEQIQEEDNASMFASRNLLEIDKQLLEGVEDCSGSGPTIEVDVPEVLMPDLDYGPFVNSKVGTHVTQPAYRQHSK